MAVVISHMLAGPPGEPSLWRIATFSWHVPLFFFLTGYLWNTGRSLRYEVNTRARSLLLPFAAWTIVLGVPLFGLATLQTGFPARDVWLTIYGGGLLRGTFSPYWFLPVLFFVAVLLRVLERAPRWVAWALALGGLAVSYEWGAALSNLPHDVFFTLPCLLFALVGQEARKSQGRVAEPVATGLGLLIVSGALLYTRRAAPLDMKLGDFGTPVLSVAVSLAICFGLLLVAQGLLGKAQYRWAPFVSELAIVSVVVLLTHTFLFRLLGPLSLSPVTVIVISLVLSWVLAFALRRTALSPVLVGVPRQREIGLK